MKDWLGWENARNKQHAKLYEGLLKYAFRDQKNVAVLIGHHLTFEINGDIESENEIPSADTVLFDHDIMKRVFGANAESVMIGLVTVPCDQREDLLRKYMGIYDVPIPNS